MYPRATIPVEITLVETTQVATIPAVTTLVEIILVGTTLAEILPAEITLVVTTLAAIIPVETTQVETILAAITPPHVEAISITLLYTHIHLTWLWKISPLQPQCMSLVKFTMQTWFSAYWIYDTNNYTIYSGNQSWTSTNNSSSFTWAVNGLSAGYYTFHAEIYVNNTFADSDNDGISVYANNTGGNNTGGNNTGGNNTGGNNTGGNNTGGNNTGGNNTGGNSNPK